MSTKIGKVASHDEDQNELDPLRWLEVYWADSDPALRSQHLVPHQLDGQQRQQTDSVGPGNQVDQLVVVDLREEKHRCQPAGDPVKLLGVEAHAPWNPYLLIVEEAGVAGVFGVQRGRVDLEH